MIEPDMFKCAISVNGVADIPDMLKFVAAINGNDGSSMKFWTKVIGDRYKDKDIMIAQSPADNADKIKAEILLVHGTDDMTVPLQQSEAMAKALKKTGRPKKIIELPNDDHNLSLAQSRKKLLEESEKFFSKHLD
jgi:dipeptidyl aminopeptidase/acylaminoacyl peptidase